MLTPQLGIFFKLALQCIESIAYRDINVFMGMMFARLAADDKFLVRHFEVDTNMKQTAFMMMPVVFFYNDTATNDIVMEPLKLFDALTNIGIHSG